MMQIAIAIDQLLNTFLGGWADETLSARMWRHRGLAWWREARWLVDKLFFWQHHHCYQSFVSELQRKHLPTDYQEWM